MDEAVFLPAQDLQQREGLDVDARLLMYAAGLEDAARWPQSAPAAAHGAGGNGSGSGDGRGFLETAARSLSCAGGTLLGSRPASPGAPSPPPAVEVPPSHSAHSSTRARTRASTRANAPQRCAHARAAGALTGLASAPSPTLPGNAAQRHVTCARRRRSCSTCWLRAAAAVWELQRHLSTIQQRRISGICEGSFVRG